MQDQKNTVVTSTAKSAANIDSMYARRRIEVATHAQLVKLVHVVLDEHPALLEDDGELAEQVKRRLAQLRLVWRQRDALTKALDCAVFQRRHCLGRAR